MINSITGIITAKTPERLFLDNSGFEWEIHISRSTFSGLPETGNEYRILTVLQHKEDSMRLFGFSSAKERELFGDLVKVNGVGPGLAIKILSGMPPASLITALDRGDEATLSGIPGLGKKTAQKIILSLRGKISMEEINGADDIYADIITALADMGFERRKASDTIRLLIRDFTGDLSDEAYEKELFRRAIQRLSTG